MDKPKTNYLTLTLVSLCFVLFLTGAYYLGRQSIKPVEVSTTIPTIVPSPTTPTNPTSEWKTYTDNNWNYIIKYPKDWKIITHQKPTIDIISPDQGSISLSLTLNQETPTKPTSFINSSMLNPSPCSDMAWAVANNDNDAIVCWKYNRDVWFIPKYSLEVDRQIYYQILSTFEFTENKAESLGNWVKRSNGDFQTNCLWISVGKANDNGGLEQYVKNLYRSDTDFPSLLNPQNYIVKNHETITVSSQGIGELFNVYFSKDSKKYSITFSVTSQDDILSKTQCKNYQADIDYVLNNVDLFL